MASQDYVEMVEFVSERVGLEMGTADVEMAWAMCSAGIFRMYASIQLFYTGMKLLSSQMSWSMFLCGVLSFQRMI